MTRARLLLSLTGLALALIGVVRNDRRFIWPAIAALILSVGLRIASRRRSGR
jgi:hypothetical protein